MLKFFSGLIIGILLVVLLCVIGLFALAGARNKPPSIASGSTLVLHLQGSLPEKAPVELPFGIFDQKSPMTLEEVWGTLRKAAGDSRIKAVVVEPYGLQIGWGKMQELHADLQRFRASGKPLIAYLKTPGTREFYVATAASEVYLEPEDVLSLKGLRFELMYFKHTLDKLGVSVDVEHAGKYKDFGDMFTRTEMSPETREVLTSVIDRLYADLVKTIGTDRKKSAAEIQSAIDNGPLLSKDVLQRGLVDGLCYEDEMFGRVKKRTNSEVKKVRERDYQRASTSNSLTSDKHTIAFLVAQGDILRGDPESGSNDEDAISSESFLKLLAKLGNDSKTQGVIVRIDSPGGESFASDALWRGMNELARKKPVVVSMSDTAASGGYYMAMNGSPIVAYPGTLTGSVGVVFGKPNLHGLYDKVGVDKDEIARGRFADIDSDYKPMTDAERAKLREGIDDNYRTFVQKVASSRKKPFSETESLAQGRVWLGEQAKENGLVDELGGLDQAIQIMKRKAGIATNETVRLVPFPPRRSWLDVLLSSESSNSSVYTMLPRLFESNTYGLAGPSLALRNERVWLKGGYLSVSPWALSFE